MNDFRHSTTCKHAPEFKFRVQVNRLKSKTIFGFQSEVSDFMHHPRISPRNPPPQNFQRLQLQGAIDFAALRMRSWRRGANGGAECRTFFGVAGFAPKPTF